MSKISDVYDAFVSMVQTELPTYYKITNPYDPISNPEFWNRKGFGVGFGPAANTNRLLACHLSVERVFSFVLINQVLTTEHNVSQIATAEKAIFEDQFKIIKALEKDPTMQTSVIKSVYQSDGGLEFLEAEGQHHILLSTDIAVEYLENLT